MSDVISPDPVTEWHPEYLPAYLSNGVMGMRVGKVPLTTGTAILNGLEGLDPANEVEAFARAPYPLAGDIGIGRTTTSAAPERLTLREQRYDFSCGELYTHFDVAGDDGRVEVETLIFCSRTQPTLVLHEMSLRVDRDCDLKVAAVIDTRGLLNFRHTRMHGARANAMSTGREGLQYPWESSLRYGQEAAPVDAAAHHVSMDVAIGFARFIHATGDREFARNQGWSVMSGVAEWIGSRAERTDRGCEFKHVIGIAEADTTVDNNAFVNMAAIVALREAATLGRDLGLGTPDAWDRMTTQIVLPLDRERGIIVNHDGWRVDEEKGETPEAPAGFFPLGFDGDPEIERRTLKYYLGFANKYAGAPMLSSMLGVYAARVGDRDAALELFERGYADFVIDPYRITAEWSPKVYPDQPVAGPFTANLGGFLMACMYGLTGIRLKQGPPESWCERPVVMPRGWDGVHVERIWVRGTPGSITAEHGADRARIAPDYRPGL